MHPSPPTRHSRIAAGRATRLRIALFAGVISVAWAGTSASAGAVSPSVPGSSATAAPSADRGSHAAGRATFGVGPATLGKVDQRGYFSYVMGVGGIYTDQAAVLNYGSTPLTLTVFAADLGNADDGTVEVGLQNQAPHDAGGWIALPRKQVVVTVPAATKSAVGRVVLPFRITVPADASPGDHGAAIVAVLSTIGKNPKGENVRLDQRIASRMYLRVNGPLRPGLRIEGLSVAYHRSLNPLRGGSATVRYTVHNVGNVRLAAKQSVAVTGMFGTRTKVVTPANLQLLFPGASSAVTVTVPGVLPTLFEKSRVSVTPQLFQDQKPMPVPTATATASFTAVPWPAIGFLALLILLFALGWHLRRPATRRPPRGGRHGAGSRPPGGPDNGPRLSPQTPETIAS
jgi:hypothetical protein